MTGVPHPDAVGAPVPARHAWLDVTAGVAGDMLLGAVLDAGAPLAGIQRVLDELVPGQVRLATERVLRGGQAGTKARVEVLVADQPHRTWASIRTMLTEADLPGQTRAWSLAAFEVLAQAEAATHGTDPDQVHFHEVGALDSIADVVGSCEGLRLLGVGSVSASALSLGAGRIRAAHGDIPVPVPAVARMVLGWQVLTTSFRAATVGAGDAQLPGDGDHGHHHAHAPWEHRHEHEHGEHEHRHGEHEHQHGDHEHQHGDHGHDHGHQHDLPHDQPAAVTTPGQVGELATPTGVALVRALATRCESLPAMTVTGLGVGCGGKDFVDHPNVVRLLLGELAAAQPDPDGLHLLELAANVDDLDPRLWPGVLDALLAAGARDAWLVPIQMKKGRPGFTVHALATASAEDAVGQVLLQRTSTLGYRRHAVARAMAARGWTSVDVLGEQVAVKVGHRDGLVLHATVEFDELAAAAARLHRPEAELAQLAEAAIVAAGIVPGADVAGLGLEER